MQHHLENGGEQCAHEHLPGNVVTTASAMCAPRPRRPHRAKAARARRQNASSSRNFPSTTKYTRQSGTPAARYAALTYSRHEACPKPGWSGDRSQRTFEEEWPTIRSLLDTFLMSLEASHRADTSTKMFVVVECDRFARNHLVSASAWCWCRLAESGHRRQSS